MRWILALSILALYTCVTQAQPQTFSSGSTGADGALTYAPNLGTVYFPPSGLAQRANNIYNFTTITIATGTTVRVSGWVINGPVYLLAQSDVTISGTLDLSGQVGHAPNNPSYRTPSEPGAGGYSGGVSHGAVTGQNATSRNGPGGGAAPGSDSAHLDAGAGATYSGSTYLQPLIGGSGGGGGCRPTTTNNCAGGGAGGGAILIASSTKITITGFIGVQGGAGGSYYGGGAGGELTGTGSNGGPGIVRFEAFNIAIGNVTGTTPITSIPYNLALPVSGPSLISATSINNITVNANPFSFPDATIATGTAVPVVISGVNVPSGTTGNLYIYSETAADQVIPFTLTGTLQSTTATVNVPYPSGGSRGFAKAVWTSQ